MTARSKRPVVLRPLTRVTGRDAVWSVIRQIGADGAHFTVTDIARVVVSGPDLIRDYLPRLVAAGIVGVVEPGARGKAVIYRLNRDCGVEPPRLTAEGAIDETPTDQERIWQAMKVLPVFDARDLQAGTGIVSAVSVRSYISMLARAGYLAVVEPATTRRLARYRLLRSRNTGPRPPVIRRGKVVFDPNLGRQVWPEVAA